MSSAKFLSEAATGRNNNLNLLRMLAAFGVLISHAHPLTQGPGAPAPLAQALLGKDLGDLCVDIFFAISGFLISMSFARSAGLGAFWRARALRIWPGLFVALMVTAVAGAALTASPPSAYGADAPVYVLRNLTLFSAQWKLSGMFEANPYPLVVNGSLWTLEYEVKCYLAATALGLLGALRSRRRMGVALVAFAVWLLAMERLDPGMMARLALPFGAGMALFVWRDRIRLSWTVGAGLAALALAFRLAPPLQPAFHEVLGVATAYWVVLIGYAPKTPLLVYNRLGDYSYGFYIYAFPVQQAVVSLGPAGMTPMQNIWLAAPITLIFAVLSWTLVERPALARAKRRAAPARGVRPR